MTFGAELAPVVREHAAARETEDLRAAASLLFSGFANHVTGPVLAELVVQERVVLPRRPSCRARSMLTSGSAG